MHENASAWMNDKTFNNIKELWKLLEKNSNKTKKKNLHHWKSSWVNCELDSLVINCQCHTSHWCAKVYKWKKRSSGKDKWEKKKHKLQDKNKFLFWQCDVFKWKICVFSVWFMWHSKKVHNFWSKINFDGT